MVHFLGWVAKNCGAGCGTTDFQSSQATSATRGCGLTNCMQPPTRDFSTHEPRFNKQNDISSEPLRIPWEWVQKLGVWRLWRPHTKDIRYWWLQLQLWHDRFGLRKCFQWLWSIWLWRQWRQLLVTKVEKNVGLFRVGVSNFLCPQRLLMMSQCQSWNHHESSNFHQKKCSKTVVPVVPRRVLCWTDVLYPRLHRNGWTQLGCRGLTSHRGFKGRMNRMIWVDSRAQKTSEVEQFLFYKNDFWPVGISHFWYLFCCPRNCWPGNCFLCHMGSRMPLQPTVASPVWELWLKGPATCNSIFLTDKFWNDSIETFWPLVNSWPSTSTVSDLRVEVRRMLRSVSSDLQPGKWHKWHVSDTTSWQLSVWNEIVPGKLENGHKQNI